MKIIFSSLLLLWSVQLWALDVPPLKSPVEDQADILTIEEEQSLAMAIRKVHEQGLAQISVLIIPSLEGEVLEEYSMKVAEKWQLGSKEKDNGLLLLVALKEKKIRLEVGNGIEGEITDSRSSRIIREMGPYMRRKDFKGAIGMVVAEVQSTLQAATPEAKAAREEEKIKQQIQQAQTMKALAEGLVWILNGVLILLGLYWVYYNFVGSRKIKQEILAEITTLKNNQQESSKQIKSQQEVLSSLKVDNKKYNYLKKVQQVKNLQSEKSRLQGAISTMKDYLGV